MCCVVLLPGCTHVLTQNGWYYADGPRQLEGPQGELAEGTHVLVVGKDSGYSRVWALDAFDVYVWDGALRPLWGSQESQAAAQRDE